MKKILLALSIVVAAIFLIAYSFALGGGGSDQVAPDSVKAGEPAAIKLYVDTWGDGGPIKGRYTKIALHYKLASESAYKTVLPKPIPLPENYQRAVSKTSQWEAYEFTIPPYPEGTTGEIQYYIEMTLDGYLNRADGMKKIKVN